MKLRKNYQIPDEFIREADRYARLSREYTSNRHDFHKGGLANKQKKMFEGKLGEKIFKMFLIDNCIPFKEDSSSYEEADTYDFVLQDGLKIDVKTRTKHFHTRTLEMVEQFQSKPKDIYILVRLHPDEYKGSIIGWFSKEALMRINRIENQGYLDNYVMYDNELSPIEELYDTILINYLP